MYLMIGEGQIAKKDHIGAKKIKTVYEVYV